MQSGLERDLPKISDNTITVVECCYYLRRRGLSSSVNKVIAFPLCPALPVRPIEKTKQQA